MRQGCHGTPGGSPGLSTPGSSPAKAPAPLERQLGTAPPGKESGGTAGTARRCSARPGMQRCTPSSPAHPPRPRTCPHPHPRPPQTSVQGLLHLLRTTTEQLRAAGSAAAAAALPCARNLARPVLHTHLTAWGQAHDVRLMEAVVEHGYGRCWAGDRPGWQPGWRRQQWRRRQWLQRLMAMPASTWACAMRLHEHRHPASSAPASHRIPPQPAPHLPAGAHTHSLSLTHTHIQRRAAPLSAGAGGRRFWRMSLWDWPRWWPESCKHCGTQMPPPPLGRRRRPPREGCRWAGAASGGRWRRAAVAGRGGERGLWRPGGWEAAKRAGPACRTLALPLLLPLPSRPAPQAHQPPSMAHAHTHTHTHTQRSLAPPPFACAAPGLHSDAQAHARLAGVSRDAPGGGAGG